MNSLICPLCGYDRVDLLSSTNKIFCFGCEKFSPKPLKPGQKSILIKNLKGEEMGISDLKKIADEKEAELNRITSIAKSECAKANGDDWNAMFSGDQYAQISSWISGYMHHKGEKK